MNTLASWMWDAKSSAFVIFLCTRTRPFPFFSLKKAQKAKTNTSGSNPEVCAKFVWLSKSVRDQKRTIVFVLLTNGHQRGTRP